MGEPPVAWTPGCRCVPIGWGDAGPPQWGGTATPCAAWWTRPRENRLPPGAPSGCLGRMTPHRVLRREDPEAARLLAAGWVVAGESWGARFAAGPEHLARLDALAETLPGDYRVRVLTPDDAADIAALDRATCADYPRGAAVFHDPVDLEGARSLTERGAVHGVRTASGDLVAMTATRASGDLVETAFTAVHPAHRRRGLAAAVKAASVAAGVRAGHRLFGTGGAAVNAGSLAMNRAVGYIVTEHWVTLVASGGLAQRNQATTAPASIAVPTRAQTRAPVDRA